MHNSPIFVVGVPRSGTTLLATLLSGHSNISGGPETHVLNRLARCTTKDILAPARWPSSAVDFLFSVVHAGNPVPVNYRLSRGELETYLRSRLPSVAAVLEALTDAQRLRVGKTRWVEKTPDHLPYVREIRRHFPDARIIRIIRDPRDVALSLTRVPWGPTNFCDALLLWQDYDRRSRGFFESDTETLTVRYEDVTRAPEQELRRVCAFIGEVFEPAMMDTEKAAMIVDSYRRPWLSKVHQPIDNGRSRVWQKELTNDQLQLAESLLGDRLLSFQYDSSCDPTVRPYAKLEPAHALRHFGWLIEDLARKNYRLWPAFDKEHPVAILLLSSPWWTARRRLLTRLPLLLSLAVRQARYGNVFWIPKYNEGRSRPGWTFSAMMSRLAKSQRELQKLSDRRDSHGCRQSGHDV